MIQYIKDALKNGFSLPLAKDGETGKPSATLWFAYVSFFIAVCSEIYFICVGDHLHSTATAIVFWVLAMVFFRMGQLGKVKVDLKDEDVEIDSENKNS